MNHREPVVIVTSTGQPIARHARRPQRPTSTIITWLSVACMLIAFYDLLLLALNVS